MAQANAGLSGGGQLMASNVVTLPATGNTQVLKINVVGLTRLFVQLSNATQALDALVIQAKAHPDATAITLFSTAAHFTGPVDPMVNASGDLTVLAAGGTGWFLLNVVGMYEITILASAAVDSAVLTVYANGQ